MPRVFHYEHVITFTWGAKSYSNRCPYTRINKSMTLLQ